MSQIAHCFRYCFLKYTLYVCSVVSDSLQPRELYVAHQVPLSMEFSKQEYWGRLPFPSSYNYIKEYISREDFDFLMSNSLNNNKY